jgi:hypothetical protein
MILQELPSDDVFGDVEVPKRVEVLEQLYEN